MPDKKQTFEQAMQKLQEIITHLESETLSLDEALDYFEKGIRLMRTCEDHLKGAEGRLKELIKGDDGEFIEKILGDTLTSVTGGDDFDE